MRLTTSAGTYYGYQGPTILLTSLQIPATAQPGAVELRGDLYWLVCHDICVPQSTHLEAPIRIATEKMPSQSETPPAVVMVGVVGITPVDSDNGCKRDRKRYVSNIR